MSEGKKAIYMCTNAPQMGRTYQQMLLTIKGVLPSGSIKVTCPDVELLEKENGRLKRQLEKCKEQRNKYKVNLIADFDDPEFTFEFKKEEIETSTKEDDKELEEIK